MAQTLLLGLGGTGARIVNRVVKELHKNGKEINNGEISCAVLDTDGNDNKHILNSGTGVPVIPTSSSNPIETYIKDYRKTTDIKEWCPTASAFLRQGMKDGASEIRLKSRIAFMDCALSGRLQRELGPILNRVRQNDPQAKLRIMIVASLAGGTGSGMFIQVALWLRRFLHDTMFTIRGIFLLPDIFANTEKTVQQDPQTQRRHYANTYAAIKELNAITKVMRSASFKLPDKIKIGQLFDSDRDRDSGKKVYDYAFFIDYMDANRLTLENSLPTYEDMVAQLVYMQLYAPMKDDMYSVEDNLFTMDVQSEDPLYGSCGVAKAVYPMESVREYCCIRAMQDSLATGWGRIDSEIEVDLEEQRRKERDNEPVGRYIEPRSEYIRHFDEYTSVKPDEAGRDRFFLSIAMDVKNKVPGQDELGNPNPPTDKIDDFVSDLKREIKSEVNKYGGLNSLCNSYKGEPGLDEDPLTNSDEQQLVEIARSDDIQIKKALKSFEDTMHQYATALANAVCPYSMGDVNAANACSVYGLLTNGETGEKRVFVHPVAARYLLYKLVDELQKERKGLNPKKFKDQAERYIKTDLPFDNERTAETEMTPEDYIGSKRLLQGRKGFLNNLRNNYFAYMKAVLPMYTEYEIQALKDIVYSQIIGRLEGLITKFEEFFRSFGGVQRTLGEMLDKNVRETDRDRGRTTYVLGGRDSKEGVYRSLKFRETGDSAINKSVIHTLYGTFCAQNRPDNPHNAEYRDLSVKDAFIDKTLGFFAREIEEDPDNRKCVDLDIYTAIGKENEVNGNRYGLGNDLAFKNYTQNLREKAAEFIVLDRVIKEDDDVGSALDFRHKEFWGFNPVLMDISIDAVKSLGIDEDRQANDAYPKNEICCYRAVYGIRAEDIPKFRELDEPGYYYQHYNYFIKLILRGDERILSVTPHLDKRWHNILPSISAEKRAESEDAFYHAFWLAIAYGRLYADNSGYLRIKRVVNRNGRELLDDRAFTENGSEDGRPLRATEVVLFIKMLRMDSAYMSVDIPALEKLYVKDIKNVDKYVNTDVMKGLRKPSELNPVKLMLRIKGKSESDEDVMYSLIAGLEKIAGELAENKDIRREGESLAKSKYSICRMVYDSYNGDKESEKVKQDKERVFSSWVEKFAEYNLKETGKPAVGGEADAAEAGAEEDI